MRHRTFTMIGAVSLILVLGSCAQGQGPSPAAVASSSRPASTPSPTAAPQPDLAAPGTRLQALQWAGLQRTYVVHAPPDFRPGQHLPLVLALHWRSGTAERMELMTGLDAKADRERFLVVYPNGVDGGFNGLICCGELDDVGFLRALIGHMRQFWRADPKRVYATGMSNGADMSYRLAVELPGTIAAIAPVSGGYIGQRVNSDPAYIPRRPVSVITFIGKSDRSHASMEQGLATWKQRLACRDAKPASPRPNLVVTTAACRDGSNVVLYSIKDMAHMWPGGVPGGYMSDPTVGISATDLLWEFFKSHPLR